MSAFDREVEGNPLLTGVTDTPYRGEEGVERMEEHGDFVVAVSQGRMRGRASGAEIRQPVVQLGRFRNGKCVWWRTFRRVDEALDAMKSLDRRVRSQPRSRQAAPAAIADRDLDRLLALTAPEVEWESFFGLGEGGAYRGHGAMPQYLRDIDKAFEVLRPEARDLLESGTWSSASARSTTGARAVVSKPTRRLAGCSGFATERCCASAPSGIRSRRSRRWACRPSPRRPNWADVAPGDQGGTCSLL